MPYNNKSLDNLKPGCGRPLGSKNNASKRVAQILKDAADINIDLFKIKMHQLSDKDFCNNYIKIIELMMKEERLATTDTTTSIPAITITLASQETKE